MTNTTKQIIAIAGAAGILVVMYIGSYLPFKKAQIFIRTQTTPVRTFQEYNTLLDKALDFYSPIGQEETLLNYLYFIGDAIPQAKDDKVVELLLEKAERHARPIIERGPGLNLVQILYHLGVAYKQAGFRLKNPVYVGRAIEVFELGRSYSPKRPIFLQELFNLYRQTGNKEKLREISEVIISLWPDQEKEVRQLIEESLSQ